MNVLDYTGCIVQDWLGLIFNMRCLSCQSTPHVFTTSRYQRRVSALRRPSERTAGNKYPDVFALWLWECCNGHYMFIIVTPSPLCPDPEAAKTFRIAWKKNCVIFIAPINNFNPISRSYKSRLIELVWCWLVAFCKTGLVAVVKVKIPSRNVWLRASTPLTCLHLFMFFLAAADDNAIAAY